MLLIHVFDKNRHSFSCYFHNTLLLYLGLYLLYASLSAWGNRISSESWSPEFGKKILPDGSLLVSRQGEKTGNAQP
jgi:hypothetical protein